MKTNTDRFAKLFAALFAVSIVAFVAILFVFNPEHKVLWQYIIVYTVLFGVLFCGFTFFGYKIRLFKARTGASFASKKDSVRQGIFFSICAVALLGMQVYGVLSWWIALILIAAIVVTELYFISRR